jgi:hypothetical protein
MTTKYVYQIGHKICIPNDQKVHPMPVKYIKDLPKFTKNCIFGMKMCVPVQGARAKAVIRVISVFMRACIHKTHADYL